MAVVAMKKVFIVSLLDYKEAMVQQLQKMGILQITDLKERLSQPEWAAMLREESLSESISQQDAKLSEWKFAIEFLGSFDQRKKSFIETFTGSKVLMTRDTYKNNARRTDICDGLHQKSRALDEKLNQLRNEVTANQGLIEQLVPWTELKVPLAEIKDTRYTRAIMGTVEKEFLLPLQTGISETAPESYFHIVSTQKNINYVLLIYLQASEGEVATALRNANFSRVSFPELTETPAASVAAAQAKIAGLEKEIGAAEAQASEMLKERPFLLAAYDSLASDREQNTIVRNFARTDRTCVIEGWVKAKDLERLSQAVHQITEAVAIEVREPEEGETIPVFLQNNKLIEPFEAVTELYALPLPGGLDPTPIMAPFFFVFFGFMLGDAGYGIVLSLLAWFAMKKIKMAGMGKKLFQLLFTVGIATFFFGVLTGSYFGDLIPIRPIWFNPSTDPMRMIGVSLILGVVQVIYVGLGIKFYLGVKKGRFMDSLFDVGSWMVFLTGLILLGVGGSLNPALPTVGKGMAAVGGLTILLMTSRKERNPLKRIGSGLYALYGVSSYLGDILSYSRLLALGLASGVIATVFNSMGRMIGAGGTVGMVLMVVFLIGAHTFNLVINILGAFVHSSRLQYVEFFGKFYESGGKKFSPFKITTKYVDLD